jgi:hypothetical protein
VLPAARQHAVPHLGRSRRDGCTKLAAARSPAALALGKDSKTTVLRDDRETSLTGSDTYHDATCRMIWSVPLQFQETAKQRRYRSHQILANQAIQKGWSARKAAEGQHFFRGSEVLSRKDVANQKWSRATEADLRAMLDHELFVKASIEMVQYYDADDLLRGARAYLAELEAKRARAQEGGPQFVRKQPAPLVPLSPPRRSGGCARSGAAPPWRGHAGRRPARAPPTRPRSRTPRARRSAGCRGSPDPPRPAARR